MNELERTILAYALLAIIVCAAIAGLLLYLAKEHRRRWESLHIDLSPKHRENDTSD